MISTTTIISPPSLLWSLTNGDGFLPPLNIELSLFLKIYSIGRCWTTNRSIQNRTNSSPSASWRMENSTVRLETRWTLHLGSVGGEGYLFFPLVHVSSSNAIAVLVEFVPGNILLIQLSHSLLRLFCQLLTWLKKWMRMVGKLSPRGNIINLQWYGKFHFSILTFLAFKCSFIVNHLTSLAWSSRDLVIQRSWSALLLS